MLGEERLGVGPVGLSPDGGPEGLAPGQVVATKSQVWVGTGSRAALLGQVRPAGKRDMLAADWARGLRGEIGRLG